MTKFYRQAQQKSRSSSDIFLPDILKEQLGAGPFFLLRGGFLYLRFAFSVGILISAASRFILFMFRSRRYADDCYFLNQKKVTKD